MSHTNENEYNAFVGNRKSEALQDRIIMIKVPYNMRVSQEERIYDKLLKQSERSQHSRCAQHSKWRQCSPS
jgi:serine protein kinase